MKFVHTHTLFMKVYLRLLVYTRQTVLLPGAFLNYKTSYKGYTHTEAMVVNKGICGMRIEARQTPKPMHPW